MRRRWRWAVVSGAVAVLVAVPFLVTLLPAGGSSVDARTLLARINRSAGVAYSGYAQSTGGLGLPVSTGAFSVNDLLGGTTRTRVWWRGSTDWRVDAVDATGETDLHHTAEGTWTWDYESNTARWTSGAAEVRLPRTDDLVPANLTRRLLGETNTTDVARLPAARIAGQDAAGLRVRLADARSTITHIDVWALPASGLPVRIAVYGATGAPVVSATMYDLDLARPAASVTAFASPTGSNVHEGGPDDIVAAIDQFGRGSPPESLLGLPRRTDLRLGAVGAYGRGVTLVVAIPLSAHLAGDVVPQLRQVPGATEDDAHGIGVAIGPISVQLSPPTGYGARWMLVGTLTPKTLKQAVTSLPPALGFGYYGHANGPDRAAMIRTHGLTKRYGKVLAVDSIDLDVHEGDVYGFLGANGSGKTTTVRTLLGLVLATSGEIELLGESMPRAARRVLPQVGTLVEGPAAYGHLSARANLDLFDAAGPSAGTASLDIRSTSADAYVAVSEVPRGTKLKITGVIKQARMQIIFDGAVRWVTARYLATKKPSVTGGAAVEKGLKPNAVKVHRAAMKAFPQIVTYYGVRKDPIPDHPSGRALDLMLPGSYRSASSQALGYRIRDWARAHARELGIQYVIFHQHIWNIQRDSEGWRLMGSRGSDTANHINHVHITVYG